MPQDIRQNASEKPVKEPTPTKRSEVLENMTNECNDEKRQMSDCERKLLRWLQILTARLNEYVAASHM